MRHVVLATLLLSALCALTPALAAPLRVAAASDLRGALPKLLQHYAQRQPELRVEVSYSASGKLSAQIAQGAPFDLFLSADEAYVERLTTQGLAGPSQRYARGRLALWLAGEGPPLSRLSDLPPLLQGKLALANPRHAPYGQRAREALQSAGVWEALQEHIVYGENVAQATQMAATGAAQAALVAGSLATMLPEPARRLAIDPSLHQPLWQAGAVLRRSEQAVDAQALLEFLRSDEAQALLVEHGFASLVDADS